MTATANETELIARHIKPDPYHPGPDDVCLVRSGVSVWAIIGHLPSVAWDIDRAAEDYDIAPVEVRAAVAYYHRYRGAIDARLAANSGWVPSESLAKT